MYTHIFTGMYTYLHIYIYRTLFRNIYIFTCLYRYIHIYTHIWLPTDFAVDNNNLKLYNMDQHQT